jgi:hypothetical protein
MMTLEQVLLETAAVALAGLTALSLLAHPGLDRSSYPAPATAHVERQTAPVELSIQEQEAALRDMRLHD